MAHEPTRRDRPNGGRNGYGNGSYNGYPSGVQNVSEQIRDILHVVFKRKRLIAIVFLAGFTWFSVSTMSPITAAWLPILVNAAQAVRPIGGVRRTPAAWTSRFPQ